MRSVGGGDGPRRIVRARASAAACARVQFETSWDAAGAAPSTPRPPSLTFPPRSRPSSSSKNTTQGRAARARGRLPHALLRLARGARARRPSRAAARAAATRWRRLPASGGVFPTCGRLQRPRRFAAPRRREAAPARAIGEAETRLCPYSPRARLAARRRRSARRRRGWRRARWPTTASSCSASARGRAKRALTLRRGPLQSGIRRACERASIGVRRNQRDASCECARRMPPRRRASAAPRARASARRGAPQGRRLPRGSSPHAAAFCARRSAAADCERRRCGPPPRVQPHPPL